MRTLHLFISLLLLPGLATAAEKPRAKKEVGWIEEVRLSEVGTVVKAKMDTGATTSSIDSEIIDIRKSGEKTKDRSGETVVFSVMMDDGAPKTFEREIKRYVRIKLKGGGYVRRPVIEMRFCIAGREVTEEVNLANRENFIYPVLIGRNMMRHADLVINPAAKHLSQPYCRIGE